MKRYVKELANDCKRELESSMQFALDTGRYYGTLTAEKEEEINIEYDRKLARIDELVKQCQYGYISDLKAAELIVSV